jgi:hypothetical protein
MISRSLILHLDGTETFETRYDCQIVGTDIHLIELIRSRRTGEDKEWWSHA